MAYERANYPPARCSPPFGDCVSGNSDVEPLIVSKVDGVLSIAVCAFMYVPMTDDEKDKAAADRALAFNVAWIAPIPFASATYLVASKAATVQSGASPTLVFRLGSE
ncbi:hypothetical protein SASPL_152528 [Salvia splendens]|uniref:Uncharacterized protein n=1 Tax=Salvia splendens TaxID=180675 RepID=A0A8X8Z0F7_SALSN|nr:hypothetical protein SASPL_152528 [Salvia splendens]